MNNDISQTDILIIYILIILYIIIYIYLLIKIIGAVPEIRNETWVMYICT